MLFAVRRFVPQDNAKPDLLHLIRHLGQLYKNDTGQALHPEWTADILYPVIVDPEEVNASMLYHIGTKLIAGHVAPQ